ncbi:PglZ domain-containing protein, partial [gut metagenome]
LYDKWFSLSDQYHSTQQGLVVNALSQSGKIAVIVGDGLRLEIADAVANEISEKVNRDLAFSSLPSVTECGMSALYGCDMVETSAQVRFAHLKEQVPALDVIILDNLNESVTAEKLLLTFGDIDQVGEKKQLAGLKDISGYHVLLAEKIKQLLAMGYNKVYLTTDHGFVITGLLDEADKIPVPSMTDFKVDERFLLSNDRFDSAFIEKNGWNMGYAYLYFAPTDKPFVSRGAYGYAHGGLTPQECIIPYY